MLIVLKPGVNPGQLEAVLARAAECALQAHVVPSGDTRVVALSGAFRGNESAAFSTLSGVARVIKLNGGYRLAARELHPDGTVVDVGGVKIGAGFTVIAGPCSIESPEHTQRLAKAVKSAGAAILRGGLYKPRTSPYSFQGIGDGGAAGMDSVRARTGLPFVTEAVDEHSLELLEQHADMIQIGARNMQNFALLKRAGRSRLPVLLKRGMSATLDEWLNAADYVLSGGNPNVVLCERGIRTFNSHARNTLDLGVIPALREATHLPVIVDPSHGTGVRTHVAPMALAALAAGADGVMVEVHDNPAQALSDGQQALTIVQFTDLMGRLRAVAAALGRPLQGA